MPTKLNMYNKFKDVLSIVGYAYQVIEINGLRREEWRLNGQLHREGAPAVIWSNGREEWFLNGLRHRDANQPAFIIIGQRREWWVNGQLHREHGPAVIWDNGRENWYSYGIKHRVGGPAVTYEFGGEEWWINGQLHRTDGPAVTAHDGIQMWYNHNQLHRIGAPAVIFPGGSSECWINGYKDKQKIIRCHVCRKINMITMIVTSMDQCVVCWDQNVSVQLNVCGHRCLCQKCCDQLMALTESKST